MISLQNRELSESDLVKRRIANHTMFLDRKDPGISKVLIESSNTGKLNREPEFIELLEQEVNNGMVALDLGANIGLLTLLLSEKVGNKGYVYAIEPNPRNFKILLRNINLNNYQNIVSAHQVAFSNCNGIAKFNLHKASNLHSLYATKDIKSHIHVKTISGDQFFKNKPLPHFIKMDIEGGEVGALEGMYRTLKYAKKPVKLLIEVHPMYYSKDNNFERQLRRFIDIGFNAKYVISAGTAEPDFFLNRGYKPKKIFCSKIWSRGLYCNVSNKDMISAICRKHNQTIKLPFKYCIKRPHLLLSRKISTNKIVRGIMIEKN